jgi:peptidyl-prolyl cis-trans isomerase A (cyclophilin A)
METTLGNVKIELFADKAPVSVKNFLDYANSGFYKDTVFHRVIPNFMAQGGGLTAALQPKPDNKPPIKNEAGNGLKNDRGTVAMARTGVVDSATSQFFINVANNDFLNHRDETQGGFGYAVFGKVIEGMDVVDKMVTAPQERKNAVFQNVPTTPIVIKAVKVVK